MIIAPFVPLKYFTSSWNHRNSKTKNRTQQFWFNYFFSWGVVSDPIGRKWFDFDDDGCVKIFAHYLEITISCSAPLTFRHFLSFTGFI